ncbi:hypothetical protein BDB01DRAFT_798483 [Pilobolus umbonatus]|nr:hypothetical protein BDB01DRAFT_798483 [Pilobolus umbonatus]
MLYVICQLPILDVWCELEDEYPGVIYDVKFFSGESNCLSAACVDVMTDVSYY